MLTPDDPGLDFDYIPGDMEFLQHSNKNLDGGLEVFRETVFVYIAKGILRTVFKCLRRKDGSWEVGEQLFT